MKYFVDTVDKRNQVLKELLLKNGYDAFDFNFKNLIEIKKGDTCVFSPAKKFTKEEIESLPKHINIVCGKLNEDREPFGAGNTGSY